LHSLAEDHLSNSGMTFTRTLFEAGALEPSEVVAQVRAWLAHARHGHTRTLCERELARLAFACT